MLQSIGPSINPSNPVHSSDCCSVSLLQDMISDNTAGMQEKCVPQMFMEAVDSSKALPAGHMFKEMQPKGS